MGIDMGGALLVLLRVALVIILVWMASVWMREKLRHGPQPKNPTDMKRR